MIVNLAFGLFVAAGLLALALLARRQHSDALAERASLLDGLADHFDAGNIDIGADGFPMLTGRLADRRHLTIALVPDTLVMRRLPQLWLVVMLRERIEKPRLSIGALMRPTGAEFYSRVHGFPERIETPELLDAELLIRGDRRIAGTELRRIGAALAGIFTDRRVKEVAATARGVRLVYQAAEGDRGNHLLLRQIRFARPDMGPDLVARLIAAADTLRDTLDAPADGQAKLSA
jgi:hypothetical protein